MSLWSIANKHEINLPFLTYKKIRVYERPHLPIVTLDKKFTYLSDVIVLNENYELYKLKYGGWETWGRGRDFAYYEHPDSSNKISPREFTSEYCNMDTPERENVSEWFRKELDLQEKRIANLRTIVKALDNEVKPKL